MTNHKEVDPEKISLEDVDILDEAQRISLKPEDTVVLMVEQPLSQQAVDRMIIQVRAALRDPDRKVLIIDAGIKIGILGDDKKD